MKRIFVSFIVMIFLGTFSLTAAPKEFAKTYQITQDDDKSEISYEDLPEAVQKALEDEKYTDWTIEKIFKVTNKSDNSVYYSVELSSGEKSSTVKFDESGNLMK